MKKESKSDLKSNLGISAAASVGALGGYVATDMIVEEVVSVDNQMDGDTYPIYGMNRPESSEQMEGVEFVLEQGTDQAMEFTDSQQESIQDVSHEESALEYQIVETDQGGQIEVAFVEIDGIQSVLADVNNDGVAEVLAADLNADGRLDGNEIAGISDMNLSADENLDCQSDLVLHDAGTLSTHNDMDIYNGDYINDADVDAYIA